MSTLGFSSSTAVQTFASLPSSQLTALASAAASAGSKADPSVGTVTVSGAAVSGAIGYAAPVANSAPRGAATGSFGGPLLVLLSALQLLLLGGAGRL